MAIVLSGGPLINATFVGATKQNIIDGIETQLLAAGWSTVSGHGTTNLLMQTPTTAGTGQGLSGRFRFKDNAGSCIQVSIESSNGSRVQPNDTTNGGHLLPGTAKQFRVLANPYQFFIFGGNPWVGREFVAGGVPYIPSNLQGIVWEAIWLQSSGISDGNGTNYGGFRTLLYTSQGNWQAICNGAVAGVSNNTGSGRYTGEVGLVVPASAGLYVNQGTYNPHRFHNDDLLLGDPLICWGTSATEEGKIKGQLWDCLVACNDLSVDMVIPINGHNMWNLTASNVGGTNNARGSLLVAVS